MAESSNNQGRTLDRALDVLECVTASREPLSLTQISRSTRLHIATTRRIIGQLTARDYLTTTPQGYTLGPRVLPLSHTFVLQDRLALISPSVLAELTHHTGLTSSVFVRTGDERVLVSRFESPNPLSYQFPVGQVLSLFLGGGKVLLAHAPQEDQDRLVDTYPPIELADGRAQNAETLRVDLQAIRDTGFFVSSSERHRGTVSITTPVRSAEGDVIASINLVAHDGTIDAVGISDHQSILMQASRRLTAQI